MSDLNEALDYFKKRAVYKKLFTIFKKKYGSLGKVVGTAVLMGLALEERLDLEGFLMKDFTENEEVKVSVKLFEKALLKSKFGELTVEDILTGYFNEELRTGKEKRADSEAQKEKYFNEIMFSTDKDYIKNWLQRVFYGKAEGSALIIRNYNTDRDGLKAVLIKLIKAIPLLPSFLKDEKRELMAVFAAKVTGYPHFFDDNTLANSILVAFLRDYFKYEDEDILSEAENKSNLLFKAGIIKDSLSNDVIAYGIRGKNRNGSLHQGMEGFFKEQEPVKLSLLMLSNLREVFAGSNCEKVHIVENPAVFSVLINYFPDKAFICSYGQLRRAVFMLLDLFEEEITFSYAGDFDPEGLLIAEKLKKRYGERLNFWKYEPELYIKYISDESLTAARLKKLEGISDETLCKIAKLIRKEKKAAYQESMLKEYFNEV